MELGKLQKKWVTSLKQHPERQIKGVLGKRKRSGFYQACCLGEAGLIMGTCQFNENGKLKEVSSNCDVNLEDSYSGIGLKNGDGKVDFNISLAMLNDDKDHTWPEIAYLIEAAPELFFTKSV